MKVYVVTSGSYSDFRLDAIFSTRENAEKYRDRRKELYKWYDENEIEEWEIDGINQDWLDKKIECWEVWFLQETSDVLSAEIYFDEPVDGIQFFDAWKGNPAKIRIYVLAEDKERAVKVAMERRSIALVSHGSKN